jgi:hypothetical protein
VKTIRRAGVIGVAFGLGFGLIGVWPAMANSGEHHHRGADDNGAAWGLNVNGDDGPAWGLDNTWHGPAWGVPVSHDDGKIELPVVLDQEGPTAPENGSWANGVSAFGIDGATITGDNPVADAYLGNAGWNSVAGWTTDRRGWLGGLLGDEGWRVGGLW